MNKFTKHTGTTAYIDLANIDTDQIIPKQFLTRIERTGFGRFLFNDWRFNADGTQIEDFILNRPERKNASILVAGANFGCGSSREHAPWSLLDHGFRAVIASGFADIFYNNSLKNGLLPVTLDSSVVKKLMGRSAGLAEYTLTIDLEEQTVSDNSGVIARFAIDEFRRQCLLNGLDDIGLTLRYGSGIADFEKNRADLTLADVVAK